MKRALTTIATFLLFANALFAQLDSIYDQGVYRTFIVHLPTDYSASNEYPLVLNLHGLNSSAAGQQSYTQFDDVADAEGFIVVYPNAIDNSWTTFGNSDSDFLTNLVDSILANYASNNCLFVTGMSQGGFMTYKFANTTSHSVTAIAVGSGNMSNALQNASASAPQIPVMHFHGTDDNLVPYNGTPPFIPPVDNTIQWWVQHNNCNTTPTFTVIPNNNLDDNSTVEKYYYGDGSNGSEVTFYKVLNGGHTWCGATPIPAFGNTNQDINQSTIIGSYFADFCSTTTNSSIDLSIDNSCITLFPNPTNGHFNITGDFQNYTIQILNSNGSLFIDLSNESSPLDIDISSLPSGLYFVLIKNQQNNNLCIQQIIKE